MKEKIFEKLLEYLQLSEDFILNESPEILQQALKYHYISSIVACISLAIAIPILFYILYCFYFYPTLDKYESRDLFSLLGSTLTPMILIFFIIYFFINLDTLIQIQYAPKYFLIKLFTGKGD